MNRGNRRSPGGLWWWWWRRRGSAAFSGKVPSPTEDTRRLWGKEAEEPAGKIKSFRRTAWTLVGDGCFGCLAIKMHDNLLEAVRAGVPLAKLSRIESDNKVGLYVVCSASTESNIVESPAGKVESSVQFNISGMAPGQFRMACMMRRPMRIRPSCQRKRERQKSGDGKAHYKRA